MTTEKKRIINRLQSMAPFRSLVEERYQKSIEAAKAGEPTAWCVANYSMGDPILMAMGVQTVYPEQYGAVCAAMGTAQEYLKRSADEGFLDFQCGYARNSLGYAAKMTELGQIPAEAPMGGMAKPKLLLGTGATCDGKFKWFQAMARYLDAPLWVLEVPHPAVGESLKEGVAEHNIRFMVEELREFVSFLERLLNKKMDWDRLSQIINDVIELNRVWRQVIELRKARPGPMHMRDFLVCMNASLFLFGDLKAWTEAYRKVYAEVKYRVDNKICGINTEEKYRLIFAQIPPFHSLKFFDDLAERGWNFVIEGSNYHPPIPADYSQFSDPLERIARFSYQFFTGFHEDAFHDKEYMGYFAYPNLGYARDYQCDGALFHALLTCRPATNQLILVQDRLMKKLKVPTLVVQGDLVDLKLFDPESALRQASAFEETMTHYRKVRKEAGLAW